MENKYLERYAKTLWWGLKTSRGQEYEAGDVVIVNYYTPAIPLAETVHSLLIEQGMIPAMRHQPTPVMEKDYYDLAGEHQLNFIGKWNRALYRSANGVIFLRAFEDLFHLRDADKKKTADRTKALKPIRDIRKKQENLKHQGWTLCNYPTKALAAEAGLTLEKYKDQIIKACYLNKRDPATKWQELYESAKEIRLWLKDITDKTKHFRVESKDIDLTVTPGAMRVWEGISGHNIPSFEIFMSPDWRGTEGKFFADMPSYRQGNLVSGVRLEFKKGIVVFASALKGEEYLLQQLEIDKGAKQVGEFSLTDKRFSPIRIFMADTLFDENVGRPNGNCHIAIGSSFDDSYAGDRTKFNAKKKRELGFNQSALHWDLINTQKKQVTAHLKDGSKKIIYANGMFTY